MANWKNKVDFSDLHREYNNNTISIQELAHSVAIRLTVLHTQIKAKNIEEQVIHLDTLQSIIDEFEGLATDEYADTDNYDTVLSSLYDWGDISLSSNPSFNGDKLCWINTF